MHPKLYSFFLLLTILIAYIWFHSPYYADFTLQLFTLSTVLFLGIKKLTQKKNVLLPAFSSAEMVLLLWLFLLIIGSTTALEAITFPLVSIVLFLLVFTSPFQTSLFVAGGVVLFILGLMPTITTEKALSLLLIPILLAVYLFAKKQYLSAEQQKNIIEQDEKSILNLTTSDKEHEYFVYSYVLPKLHTLKDLAAQPSDERSVVASQLELIIAEIEKRKNAPEHTEAA